MLLPHPPESCDASACCVVRVVLDQGLAGGRQVASPAQAQEVHAFIRKWLAENVSPDVSSATRIIYGALTRACSTSLWLPPLQGEAWNNFSVPGVPRTWKGR